MSTTLAPLSSTSFAERLESMITRETLSAPSVRVDKNANVYNCGYRCDQVYLVRSGRIKTVMYSKGGKECLLSIHPAGDLFGELCVLGGPRAETAIAMVPTVLQYMTMDAFLVAMRREGLLEDFVRHMATRLAEQQQVISDLVTVDSEQRLGSTLLSLGRKLGKREARTLRIDEKITQEELAGMVGTTRSRVGHFLKRFREAGIVEVRQGCFLRIDEERLVAYLDNRM
ncbi:Crp/Fnr family transcriptional regulator [Actinokineospora spheciospongiae]|nr:Crp/Fnr family transcriptional regulator [Actinokineospora spheciospongiae]PWW64718.1 CRP-like cAMP-binding protein [Actinokineospora spheciospongiae]